MLKKGLYSFILLAAMGSLALFMTGFVWGALDLLSPTGKADPAIPPSPDELISALDEFHYVALGDSLTRGIGDAEGKGYVGIVREKLGAELGQKLVVTNLSVSGATTADLFTQLEETGVQHVVSKANLITMTIGGNDLFRGAGDLENIELGKISQDQKTYIERLRRIFDELRRLNPEAPIYMIGLYNAFGDLEQSQTTNEIVADWNYRVGLLSLQYQGITFVPVADLFLGQLDNTLYSDHFHPNGEGYRRVAERLAGLLNTALFSGEEPAS
jgi:lysophospholipase L1-like esterase